MAILKELNEAAIRILGKTISFSSWKGIPYVRMRPSKYSFERSPRCQVMMRRMKICGKLIKSMDQSVRDAYAYWARGTSYTWKDIAVKEIMSIWHETNQCPITFRHFAYEVVAGDLIIHINVNPIFGDEGAGHGETGWGISPWGTPPSFLTEDGYLTPAIYNLAYGDPLPWPHVGFSY